MARWHELASRLPRDEPLIGAELGIWQGRMAREMLIRVPNLTLWMVDRWLAMENGHPYLDSGSTIAKEKQESFEQAYLYALKQTGEYKDRRVVCRGDINDVVETVEDAYFDYVFIDADHTYLAVINDITKWSPKIKPGGLLCGHDYDNQRSSNWGVQQAVDEYSHETGILYEVAGDHTWFMRLPK